MAAWVQRWADIEPGEGEQVVEIPPMPRGPEAVRATYTSGRAELFAAMLDQMGEPPEGAAYPLFDWMEGQRWWPLHLPNVWLGTSIESDRYVWRADHLRQTPAAVRFLSLEPLLGPLPSLDLTAIDWCIVGGESGPGARPMHPGWVRDIRDRCVDAGVPFFLKQWGEWRPVWPLHSYRPGDPHTDNKRCGIVHVNGENRRGRAFGSLTNHLGTFSGDPDGADYVMERVGKKAAGRELDGRTWDEMPRLAAP
jgi:hypothetical protein